MAKPVVVIAADHGGFALKTELKSLLADYAEKIIDVGTHSTESVDYPDYANKIVKSLLSGEANYGIAICGSGIGISMAANRHTGIRAALCHDALTAILARKHNNANVLCFGGRLIGIETAKDCVSKFFTTDFEGGRHETRIKKLENH